MITPNSTTTSISFNFATLEVFKAPKPVWGDPHVDERSLQNAMQWESRQ